MFEWKKYSQNSSTVPHYSSLLEFLNLCAQVTETWKSRQPTHSVHSFVSHADNICPACKTHPLYSCPRFKVSPHDKMVTIVRSNGLCMNCLKSGHMARQCPSSQKCKRCQRLHHTLLHLETKSPKTSSSNSLQPSIQGTDDQSKTLVAHVAQSSALLPPMLLMNSRVLITTVHGFTAQA